MGGMQLTELGLQGAPCSRGQAQRWLRWPCGVSVLKVYKHLLTQAFA